MGTDKNWLEPERYDEEALLQTAREGLSESDRQEFEETVRAWQALHPDKPLIAMIVPVHPMHFYTEEDLLVWASENLQSSDYDVVKGLIDKLHQQHPSHVVRGVELPNGDIHVVGIDPIAAQERKQRQRQIWEAHTDKDGWTWGPLPGDEGFSEYWKPAIEQRGVIGFHPQAGMHQELPDMAGMYPNGFIDLNHDTVSPDAILGTSPLSHAEQVIKKPIPDESIWKSVLAMDILDALKEDN